MLNNIKTRFSIKDLENFTGIKSHTIRIWEKRYGLLNPSRTETNIRYYDSNNFKKLLNINLLYKNGFKISKIAEFSESTLLLKAKELVTDKALEEETINSFKVAMLTFDVVLFNETYNKLLGYKSFREIFLEVFIPLLDQIGFLWQTKSLKPIHEHFISNLIIQKIQSNIERNRSVNLKEADKVFVLYLPMNEIHEIGLLYLNYELTLRNFHTIYLGQNISLEEVQELVSLFTNIHFVSYFTVEPNKDDIDNYLTNVYNGLLKNSNNKFWFLGNKVSDYKNKISGSQIVAFLSIPEMLNNL